MDVQGDEYIESPIIDILLYGSMNSGRSSFFSRYKNNKFDNKAPSSNQNSFVKPIQHLKNVVIDSLNYNIRLWDPCIQFGYTMIPNEFYDLKNTGILILGDLTSSTIREDIIRHHQYIFLNDISNHCLCVIGTKNDLVDLREISSEDMLMIAKRYGMGYMECSALTGFGVDECVLFAARLIIGIFMRKH